MPVTSAWALVPPPIFWSVNTGFTTSRSSVMEPSCPTVSVALSETGVRGAWPSVRGVLGLVR